MALRFSDLLQRWVVWTLPHPKNLQRKAFLMRFTGFIFGLFVVSPAMLWSAEAPQPQSLPITIQADSATVSESLGRSEYIGNVIIEQGALKMMADRVVLTSFDGDLESITASIDEGSTPARFEQARTDKYPEIVASANSIEYRIDVETVVLTGNAVLMQGADRYEGNRLSYDLGSGLFKVESDGSDRDRINLIINPRPKP
jgi:lipopolysaccharide export system protein LptA